VDRINYFAYVSVGRACAFALLAIATVTIGLIETPALAARVGGVLSALLAAALALKALQAPRRDYRRTELWILLDRDLAVPEAARQRLVSSVLKELYWRFARWAGLAAGGLWSLGLALEFAD
jgi:hypothetical protein